MKKILSIFALSALLAGCATNDPYEGRDGMGSSSTASDPFGVQGRDSSPESLGGTPSTHPNDPRAGIGIDDHIPRPPTATDTDGERRPQ
jgi:hypothetical protein